MADIPGLDVDAGLSRVRGTKAGYLEPVLRYAESATSRASASGPATMIS
jgi:hypothetical protein